MATTIAAICRFVRRISPLLSRREVFVSAVVYERHPFQFKGGQPHVSGNPGSGVVNNRVQTIRAWPLQEKSWLVTFDGSIQPKSFGFNPRLRISSQICADLLFQSNFAGAPAGVSLFSKRSISKVAVADSISPRGKAIKSEPGVFAPAVIKTGVSDPFLGGARLSVMAFRTASP